MEKIIRMRGKMNNPDQKKKKILLVEDDFMIAMLQIRILTDNDYQVIHVNTGEKAIETVESEETIDLVLMDINLGMGMDGTEAAVVILQHYDIPLVFLSSHTEPEIVEKTEGITSYGYIVKDSGETVLLASLKMAFKLYESIKKEKLKEQALQKSEFRYYSLFDNISSGVAIYEAVDDGADFVIRDFNRTSEIMTDTRREDVLNKKVTEVFPGVRDFGLFEAFVRVWKTGIPETLPAAHYEDKRLTRFYSNYVYRLSSGEIVAVYNDHTEKKQIEEALNESEFHFRTLADSGQGLIWASGTDMKCTYFNKVWLEFTGRTLEEEIGDGWTEGLHPDDKEYCINVYVNAFQKQEPFGMEYRIKHKDGDYRWIYDKGTPRYNHKGDFIGYIGHCLDINDRKKVEYDLINARLRAEESEERFKALHNASFGGIVIHDKGRIIECNQGLSEITGYNYEDLIGMDGLLLIAESDRHIVMSNILSGYEKPYEVMGIRKNGEVYPVRLEARNIPYRGKKVRTVEFRDISGQKKIEQELRESEKRYRILFEKMTSGFALHEMIYDENGKAIDYRFLEVNPAFEKLTGLKAIELLGKTVKEVIPGIEQYWIETYAEVVKSGKDKVFENYIKEMNKYYEVSAFSPEKGKFAVTFTDITERKQKEKKSVNF